MTTKVKTFNHRSLPSGVIGRYLRGGVDARLPRGLAAALLAAPVVYMALFDVLRVAPSIGLALTVAAALGTILLERRAFLSPLMPLFGVSIVYLVLSFAHVLPASWTVYWEQSMILRQWMWVPLLMILSSAYCSFFLKFEGFLVSNALKITVLIFFVGRASLYFAPLQNGTALHTSIYTFVPENALLFVVLLIYLFRSSKNTLGRALIASLILPLCTSVQSLFMMMLSLGVRLFGYARLAVACIVIAILAAMLVSPYYVHELYAIDSSSGFRATIWRDATEGFLGSFMVGVGFGTEYIRNDFITPDALYWTVAAEGTERRLLIGTHNTAFDVALRMGIPGLIALAYWGYFLLASALKADRSRRSLTWLIFAMLILNNGLNMGCTSINFLLCTALCSGWLMSVGLRSVLSTVEHDSGPNVASNARLSGQL